MQHFIFTLFVLFSIQNVLKSQCDPREYTRIFAEAGSFHAQGDYTGAKNRYEAAKIYACNQKDKNAADNAVNQLFEEIELLRKQAQDDRKQAESAKYRSDSLFRVANREREKAEEALGKIFFYEGKFGLSYDKKESKYGFIDKNSKELIRPQYDVGRSFDPQGLALVSQDNYGNNLDGLNLTQYLIDTLGVEYPLELRNTRVDKSTQAVDFSYSNWRFIPLKFYRNDQLRILRMNYCRIKCIPKNIEKLKYLKYIQINYNKLSKIHNNIKELKSLLSLELKGNKLNTLPKGVGELIELRVLNLNHNSIDSLPVEIGKIKKLQYLSLENNQIKLLPDEISNLKNLRVLNMRNNPLKYIPKEVATMKSLKKIDIRNTNCLVADVKNLRESMPWCEILF